MIHHRVTRLIVLLCLVGCAQHAHPPLADSSEEFDRHSKIGLPIHPPASPDTVVNLNAGWRFALNPAGDPQTPGFDAAGWTPIDLPHTWNNTATTRPATGDGWYRKLIHLDALPGNARQYLHFDGASLSAAVYLDGNLLGTHAGAWNAFDVPIPPSLAPGDHLLAVSVNSRSSAAVLPAHGGDYTKQGGLYRDVSLITRAATHLALTESVPGLDTTVSGSGVSFRNGLVTTGCPTAPVQVDTLIDNDAAAARSVLVTTDLVDSAGTVVAEQRTTRSVAVGQRAVTVTQHATITRPHLWAARADPYLYDLYVQLSDAATGRLLDLNHQQVGLRSFTIDPDTGFILNGKPYPLVGVNLHQDTSAPGPDGTPAGWAQTDAQQRQDLGAVLALGATMVRTSHYPRDPAFYADCDRTGLIVETETGVNGDVPTVTVNGTKSVAPTFLANAEQQTAEMIRQNFNHPSIIDWSLYNEIPANAVNAAFVETLAKLAHTLDPTGRYTAGETDSGTMADGINTAPDLIGWHPYDGWYGGSPTRIPPLFLARHAAAPHKPIGATEFGAGGSAFQYSDDVHVPPLKTVSPHHPQNQQTRIEEEQWAELAAQKYLYADLLWVMFDFTSSGRHEGDIPAINDKGLITRDRLTRKDAYYFYQANWNDPASPRGYSTTPVLYLSDHTWTDRHGPATIPLTIFSNLGPPVLSLNEAPPVATSPQVLDGIPIPRAYTATLTLRPGVNHILATVPSADRSRFDSVTWTYTTLTTRPATTPATTQSTQP